MVRPQALHAAPFRRLSILALAAGLVLVLTLLSAAPVNAKPSLKIATDQKVQEPAKVRFTVRTSSAHKRVALLVDGERRWVRRPRGSFVRTGYLHTRHLRPGRHRITVRAKRREGRIVKTTRVVRIASRPSDSSSDRPTSARPATASALLEAGFEGGLMNWNTAGVGDVTPTTVSDVVRVGSKSGKVLLTGSQGRSELILGGQGNGSTSGTARFREGDERFYGFSFNVRSMTYGRPGAHNLIMQFKGDGEGSPNFGLQLWDYEGKRGLWSHSDAMDGDRYLAPIAHGEWQDIVVHFKASKTGNGFYRLYLNGQLIDSRDDISMLPSDATYAYIKNGLYRNGPKIPGTSEIRLDNARLGTTLAQVQTP